VPPKGFSPRLTAPMAKPAIIQLTRHLYYNAKATPQLPLFQKPSMHRIGRMNGLKAKDFLVRQTIEQAALDHVEFSDLERRMMYFTESGEMREDLFELNDVSKPSTTPRNMRAKSRS
jgi:hypothetical protein